jgi:hypothetical protein
MLTGWMMERSDVQDELDLERESRVVGWRKAEVLVAHLTVRPRLLGRFLATAGMANATMDLEENLACTHALAKSIDALARQDAQVGKFDFAPNADTRCCLAAADLDAIVTTVLGPIRLADHLRTRCAEAVVHGRDLSPAVQPDAASLEVTVDALVELCGPAPRKLPITSTRPPNRSWTSPPVAYVLHPPSLT